MKNAATGIYTYAEFGLCVAAFLPILALSSLRHRGDPTQRMPGRWMRRLGRTSGALTPLWKFTIEGERPSDIDHRAYVVIANHASTADPFLLSWLPWDMRWIAKEELFRVPITGWALKFGGDIRLRRGEGESVRAMMREAEGALRAGISVMIFPEGTRTTDGQLLPFKDGAFDLAIRAQVPVLPVATAGTREMQPKHSTWFGKAHACAKILSPVPTVGLSHDDVPALRETCRAAIAAALPDLHARYGGASSPHAIPLHRDAETPRPREDGARYSAG